MSVIRARISVKMPGYFFVSTKKSLLCWITKETAYSEPSKSPIGNTWNNVACAGSIEKSIASCSCIAWLATMVKFSSCLYISSTQSTMKENQ